MKKYIKVLLLTLLLIFNSFITVFALDVPVGTTNFVHFQNVSQPTTEYYVVKNDTEIPNFYLDNGKYYSDSLVRLYRKEGSETTWTSVSVYSPGTFILYQSDVSIISSDLGVYTNNTFTDFFFNPPQAPGLVGAVNQVDLMMILSQVRGLIPYLILLIILWVAFLKAWRFLSTVLRGA